MDASRLRERFFALARSDDAAARAAFWAELEHIDAEPDTTVQGLEVSCAPTRRFTRLRWIAATELDERVRPRFAPAPQWPELVAAFVDPEELSYRSFENIVGLDRLFADLGQKPLRAGPARERAAGIHELPLTPSPKLQARLDRLDALGLYVPPRDPSSRGGTRFIFHSAALADALLRALSKAGLPSQVRHALVRVNPVFRCNRFEPGDAPFRAHVDSPYCDAARKHVSKYTLLVYLTGGRGEPALRFGDALSIAEIAPLTAFVFAQRLEHEGGPYLDGPKLFLRTELIYVDKKLRHEPDIARVFARACYLDAHAEFAPALAEPAAAAYDRAAAAHWEGPPGSPAGPEPCLHKRFRGLSFVANGYDYWFASASATPIEAAAVALLDQLNGKLDGVAFHKLAQAEAVDIDPREPGPIKALLDRSGPAPEPVFAQLDKPSLIPEPERPKRYMDFPSSPDFSADPFPDDWTPARNERVVDALARARKYALRRIFAAPLLLVGTELFLDPERFVILADKIHILSHARLEPVHFAGALFYRPGDFIDVDASIDAPRLLVPPIGFRVDAGLIHLTFDLFRNSWMVAEQPERVPIPRITREPRHDVPTLEPWLRAAARGSDIDRVRRELEGVE